MAETVRFRMPFLDAAQAQKHVTVNEALARVDALAGGVVTSAGQDVPPAAPTEGEVHVVGAAPTGDWSGQAGALAIRANGGWDFVAPWLGARMWDPASGQTLLYDGAAWVGADAVSSASGAATLGEVLEIDHPVGAGATSTVPGAIPDKAVVLGVTGRVTETIMGATSWSLGVAGATDRYGSGIGTALNAFAHGVSGQPLAYYGGTDLLLTSSGGAFSGGRVLLAVHLWQLVPPAAV